MISEKGGNVSITNKPSENHNQTMGSDEDHDDSAMIKESNGAATEPPAPPSIDLPPDLKKASSPKEVVDNLFSADSPSLKMEVEPARESAPTKEVQSKSSPNTPLRGSATKDASPQKQKRAWLSLSPKRWRKKSSTELKEEEQEKAEGASAEEEENPKVAAETQQPKLDEESDVALAPKAAENKADVETKTKYEDLEIVTVGEGIDGVRAAEQRNYSRTISDDNLYFHEEVTPESSSGKREESVAKEHDLSTYSPVSREEAGLKDAVTSDPSNKPGKEEKSRSKKKWYRKKPKINLSFNRNTANQKVEADESQKRPEPEVTEDSKKKEADAAVAEVVNKECSETTANDAEALAKSTHVVSVEGKAASQPRVFDAQKATYFIRVLIAFVICVCSLVTLYFVLEQEIVAVFTTSTNFLDGLCAPTPRGTELDKISLEKVSFEAPYWAPAPMKSKELFQLVCADHPRTKLEWTFEKEAKSKKLYRLAISDIDADDTDKNKILLDQKNLVSATVGFNDISVSNKKGKDEVLVGPWVWAH